MTMQEILIDAGDTIQIIMGAVMGNRAGIISGATGAGKTVTLQVLAEGYSHLGVTFRFISEGLFRPILPEKNKPIPYANRF